MDTEEYIEHKTSTIIRSIANKLAPTCVGCPLAKIFVSEDRDFTRDSHRLKVNFRCDKMGMIGPICPDKGDPTLRYAKDVGMRRLLSEDQISVETGLEYRDMKASTVEVSKLLKSNAYMDVLHAEVREEKNRIGERLHVFNEALNFASSITFDDSSEPILWIGEEGHDTFIDALNEVVTKHTIEYRAEVDRSTGICEPTAYMKEHLSDNLSVPFGIFVDFEGENFRSFTREPREVVHMPKELELPIRPQEEIYEDWGSFG